MELLLQNFIYFGDSREPVIYIYDKTNLNFISSRRLRESGGITDMAMFAREVQPSQTPTSKFSLCWLVWNRLLKNAFALDC